MKISKTILVTGAAGFIGASLVNRLLRNGNYVIGIDNINNYYDVELKKARISLISERNPNCENNWTFYKESIDNYETLINIFKNHKPDVVVNLAAQAGVRYSIENPFAYVKSNLIGFCNILECCRKLEVDNFIYASSSSVYGLNKKLPFQEKDRVDQQISFYGATKKSNEVLAYSYSSLYGIPSTGLRFFTVYGPWGRPDMAPMIFTKAILNEDPINLFNKGDMMRDFTFIDDITEGIFRCCFKDASKSQEFNVFDNNLKNPFVPHRIFNIGNNNPIKLNYFVSLLERYLDKKANINLKPMQLGDVKNTSADSSLLNKWIGFKPSITIEEGTKRFVNWYLNFYGKEI